jgi:hypothetical protein
MWVYTYAWSSTDESDYAYQYFDLCFNADGTVEDAAHPVSPSYPVPVPTVNTSACAGDVQLALYTPAASRLTFWEPNMSCTSQFFFGADWAAKPMCVRCMPAGTRGAACS